MGTASQEAELLLRDADMLSLMLSLHPTCVLLYRTCKSGVRKTNCDWSWVLKLRGCLVGFVFLKTLVQIFSRSEDSDNYVFLLQSHNPSLK